jgi:hypothetical protein
VPLVVEKYLPYLEENDLDMDQKIEFIRAMHTLVEMLLDIDESERSSNCKPQAGSRIFKF